MADSMMDFSQGKKKKKVKKIRKKSKTKSDDTDDVTDLVKKVELEVEDQNESLLTVDEGIDVSKSQPGSRRGSVFDSLNLAPSEILRRDSIGVANEPRRDSLALAGIDIRRGSVARKGSAASDEDVDPEKLAKFVALMKTPNRNVQKSFTWDNLAAPESKDANNKRYISTHLT